MSEEVIYADNQVSISTSRIVIGSTTYALRNITSVKIGSTAAKRGCAIIMLVFVPIVLIVGISGGGDNFLPGLIWAVILGVGGFFWLRACKDDHHVLISSSSGEAKALTSKDKSYIEKIVAAINDAFIRYR